MVNTDNLSAVKKVFREAFKNRYVYLMLAPVILYFIVFNYFPMYGVVIAFKKFRPSLGILGSEWIGFIYFKEFFSSYYSFRLIRNTFMLNVFQLIFAFPAPIILALLLNELKKMLFKRFVQTVSYLPHFISIVVAVGIIIDFFGNRGIFNNLLNQLGMSTQNFLINPKWFRTLYIGSDIWQGAGWGSIIYLAAISSINPELYESATVDGAGRFRKIISITIPSIMPTIVILLIFKIGGMMSIGFEKIFLLYNPSTYETADVISTFVYRSGLQGAQYSYAAAIGLFNSLVNFSLLVLANYMSRKLSETSLW